MTHIVYAIYYYDLSNLWVEVLNPISLYIMQKYISFLAAGMYCARYCIFIDDRPSCLNRFRLMARILLMSMAMLDFSLWEECYYSNILKIANYISMISSPWLRIILRASLGQ